jgi:uncharacterized damage-inducible protein DinB
MTHRTLEKLAASRQALLDQIADLSEDALDQRYGDGWTIREILTHLLNAEEDHCRVIAVVAKGEAHRIPAVFALDEHNQARLTERGRLSRSALLAALDEQRSKTEALFNRLSEDQLAMIAPHPALGEKTLDEIFRVMALHERMHTREIAIARADGAP